MGRENVGLGVSRWPAAGALALARLAKTSRMLVRLSPITPRDRARCPDVSEREYAAASSKASSLPRSRSAVTASESASSSYSPSKESRKSLPLASSCPVHMHHPRWREPVEPGRRRVAVGADVLRIHQVLDFQVRQLLR